RSPDGPRRRGGLAVRPRLRAVFTPLSRNLPEPRAMPISMSTSKTSTSSGLLSDPGRAWAPFEPTDDDAWDLARVAHLHRRAGFAASWGVLERDRRDGLHASVERLLEGEPTATDGRPSAGLDTLLDDNSAQLAGSASLTRLQGIWLYRMIFTGHPL